MSQISIWRLRRTVSHFASASSMSTRPTRRVGLIGCGTIGEAVARALLLPPDTPEQERQGVPGAELVAILVYDAAKHEAKRSWLPPAAALTSDPEAFLAAGLDIVVEAAGQPLVRSLGERCLRCGADFVVTSTGAFTDDSLLRAMRAAASTAGSGRLHLASGAMPGLDWMQCAAMGSGAAATVHVRQMKPPISWAACGHAPTEAAVAAVGGGADTDEAAVAAAWAQHGPLVIFEGPAREAARLYPKSSNVTATLALGTVGLDRTHVTLVADPCVSIAHYYRNATLGREHVSMGCSYCAEWDVLSRAFLQAAPLSHSVMTDKPTRWRSTADGYHIAANPISNVLIGGRIR